MYLLIILAVLGPCGCAGFALGTVNRRCSLVAMHEPLIVVSSPVVERGFWSAQASAVETLGLSGCSPWALERRLSSCGSWTYLLLSIWVFLQQGLNLCPRHLQVDSSPPSHQGSPQLSLFILRDCPCICKHLRVSVLLIF